MKNRPRSLLRWFKIVQNQISNSKHLFSGKHSSPTSLNDLDDKFLLNENSVENSLKNEEDYIDNQLEAVPTEEEKDRIMTMLIDWILTSRKLKPKLNAKKTVNSFWHWRLG